MKMPTTFFLTIFSLPIFTIGCHQPVDDGVLAATIDNQAVAQAHTPVQKQGTQIEQPLPKPVHKPEEVVGFQLEALRQNDSPTTDSGIKTAFRFASPGNRLVTGPVENFISLVKNPLYRPLLNHKEAIRDVIRVVGNTAQQRVRVITANSDVVVFLFTLSKQESGEYKDCWMTEAVEREEEAERKDDRHRIAREAKTYFGEVSLG